MRYPTDADLDGLVPPPKPEPPDEPPETPTGDVLAIIAIALLVYAILLLS